MEQLLGYVDFSFKYILIGFNLITLLALYIHKKNKKIKKQHHVLFIIAHPDDQAMFFAPTILSLVSDYFVHLLCLSGGQTERSTELQKSAQYLGIHQFKCINNQKLQDGMKQKWCQQTILSQVKQYVKHNNIRALFTFDEYGISGHVNHKSINSAMKNCQKRIQTTIKKEENMKEENEKQKQKQSLKEQQSKLLKIYYLQSTNLLRKYTGILQLLIAIIKQYSWFRLNYFNAYASMSIHQSQFTWYRKLWVLFSRYTYINTYQMKKVCLQ